MPAIKFKILATVSSVWIFKQTGIIRKVIPISAIIKDKYWCLKMVSFNINLEKSGIKNKKYNLCSNTCLSPTKTLNNSNKATRKPKMSNLYIFYNRNLFE